jgi:hypothetical protein
MDGVETVRRKEEWQRRGEEILLRRVMYLHTTVVIPTTSMRSAAPQNGRTEWLVACLQRPSFNLFSCHIAKECRLRRRTLVDSKPRTMCAEMVFDVCLMGEISQCHLSVLQESQYLFVIRRRPATGTQHGKKERHCDKATLV